MRTIYKYPLEITDIQYINIPESYEILSVKVQNDIPVLYAIVEDSRESRSVGIVMKGTGHPFNENVGVEDFVGTININQGNLMFHIFIKQGEE